MGAAGIEPMGARGPRVRYMHGRPLSLDLIPFKEEVRGSNPLRATDPRRHCSLRDALFVQGASLL